MQCPSCQSEVNEAAVYCQSCGARIDDPSGESSQVTGDDAPADALVGRGRVNDTTAGRRDSDEEELLWEGGYSGKAMVGTWILCAVLTMVAIFVAAYYEVTANVWMAIIAGIVLVWSAAGLTLLYRKLSVHYKITSQRLVHESGILRRVTDRIEVIDMDDITYEQGIVERMLNVGSVRIDSSDRSHPVFHLRGIDDVATVATLVDDARRKERVRRGLHIEAV